MLDFRFAEPWLWALRWLLFLAPLAAVIVLASKRRNDQRCLVACLFAFIYGVALILGTHHLAIYFGWWHYGGDTLMLNGMPVDILCGGAILFGPVLYLLFPKTSPVVVVLPIVFALHGTLFKSLEPMVVAGNGWWPGICLVFIVAHVPALYLARWTEHDRQLALRAALLAAAFGVLAFYVLPSLILIAMGGNWAVHTIPAWKLIIGLPVLALGFLIGLSAVQMFVVHGGGTPIPLDNTKRLVRTGLYAYVSNPMQLSSAIGWLAIGLMIGSVWVALAAGMAWVFVKGLVRWHHRHDLLVRFPDGWPQYRSNVGEWLPRWRPWTTAPAVIYYHTDNRWHRRWIGLLRHWPAADLQFEAVAGSVPGYREPDESQLFYGMAAIGKSLNRLNFAWAMVGAGILLLVLPAAFITRAIRQYRSTANA